MSRSRVLRVVPRGPRRRPTKLYSGYLSAGTGSLTHFLESAEGADARRTRELLSRGGGRRRAGYASEASVEEADASAARARRRAISASRRAER